MLSHRGLDYDYQEDHMYNIVVTATDMAESPLSGSTTVQVWLTSTNDKPPVMDPSQQMAYVKEGAPAGLIVLTVQAYDPDGDNLVFTIRSKKLILSSKMVVWFLVKPQHHFFILNLEFHGIQFIKYLIRSSPSVLRLTCDCLIITVLSSARVYSVWCPTDNVPPISTKFVLNRDTGDLALKESMGRDVDVYNIEVDISDGSHTTRGDIKVEIIGVNHQPTFPDCPTYSPKIFEGKPIGTSVLNVSCLISFSLAEKFSSL